MKRKAFTLLEILIVIGIIALLSVLAVSNFGAIRQSAQISFSIDTVENLINRTRDGGAFGKNISTNDNKSTCWILKFSTDEQPDQKIQQLTAPYKRSTNSCDLQSTTVQNSAPLKDTNTQLFKITTDENDTEKKQIIIMFKPPHAEIEIKDSLNSLTTISPKTIELYLGFENDSDKPEEWEKLQFQTLTGETTK